MAAIDNGAGLRRNAKPTGHEALRRLASVAVARNHFKALANYLAQGLDPNAICYEGGRHEYRSLLDKAAINDSLECFDALLEAGSPLTLAAMDAIFHPLESLGFRSDKKLGILKNRLATGKLDPFGYAWEGYTCWAMASLSWPPVALDMIEEAQAEKERESIQATISNVPGRAPARRTL